MLLFFVFQYVFKWSFQNMTSFQTEIFHRKEYTRYKLHNALRPKLNNNFVYPANSLQHIRIFFSFFSSCLKMKAFNFTDYSKIIYIEIYFVVSIFFRIFERCFSNEIPCSHFHHTVHCIVNQPTESVTSSTGHFQCYKDILNSATI